jgi:hypothetical protein
MSDQHPKRETMSLEEATLSNMWEIAAILEAYRVLTLWIRIVDS